jgi:hypothetical protein
VFLWRLAQQSLPSADVLHHQHMAPHSSCFICGEHDSWKHSLLECNMARCLWALAPEDITKFIANVQEPHARAWLAAVFRALPHEELTRVVVTLWALLACEAKSNPLSHLPEPALDALFCGHVSCRSEIINSCPKANETCIGTEMDPASSRVIQGQCWCCKSATSKNSPISSIAAVVHDARGQFIGASSVVVKGNGSGNPGSPSMQRMTSYRWRSSYATIPAGKRL